MKSLTARHSVSLLLLPLAFGQSIQPGTQSPVTPRGFAIATNPEAKTSDRVPRGFGLVIGIATYKNLPSERNLQFPERDAEQMYDVLINQEAATFKPEDVQRLIGPEATLQRMQQAIEVLANKSHKGDRVVIYFAGHGMPDSHGNGYLLPYDADPDRLVTTAYSMRTLGETVGKRIAAGWKVLFVDACHSGAVTDAVKEQVNQSLMDTTDLLVFSATRKREASFEDKDLKAGIFTYYLVRALRGEADRDEDGRVTADEVIDFVSRNVHEHAAGYGFSQMPVPNQDFDSELVLAFSPTKAAQSQAQFEDATVVIDSTQDGVEVFWDGESRGVVGKDNPLWLPGVRPGWHEVRGVKMGYAPDGPRKVSVQPGSKTPVSLRIQFAVKRKKAAVDYLEKGKRAYQRGTEQDCRQAIAELRKALDADPSYSEAALYLGRSYQVLYETEHALKYLRRAIELDPDYVEARISYASMLMDTGDTDVAIGELRQALNRNPQDSLVHSHMAHAFRMAADYDKAIAEARQAIGLEDSNGQAWIWLGDCLRAKGLMADAKEAYLKARRLTAFDATVSQKLGFLSGFLIPNAITQLGKKHASQEWIHRDQRNLIYFGLCECEEKGGNLNEAAKYCLKAIQYDSEDPFSHGTLGRINLKRFNGTNSKTYLFAARESFRRVLAINPDLVESGNARTYLQDIERILPIVRSQ